MPKMAWIALIDTYTPPPAIGQGRKMAWIAPIDTYTPRVLRRLKQVVGDLPD